MNLQPIYPPLRPGQKVACVKCSKMGATLADLHGHFGDFYCKACAEEVDMVSLNPKLCAKCRKFYARFQCGHNIGQGECDCPRCQGYCKCSAKVMGESVYAASYD